MHLVYVTSALPFSLEETWIVPEILEIQKRGHRVTVIPVRPRFAIFHDDARSLADSSICVSLLSLKILRDALAEIVMAPMTVFMAVWLLAKSRSIRILIKNVSVLPKGLWLGRLARQHAVDHIHAHFASTNATVAMI